MKRINTSKAKAEESESKFRILFENSEDAVGLSLKGDNVFFNPAYLSLFGYDTSEELIGKSILGQIAPREKRTNS
ncbi:MAG: PAS domain S-box protein [Chloroflexia bacterium]|nr:PAS domain S-box protein [Chloroflexia bacterium]